ncbi:MAG: hypothetical protein R2750_04710 [Bacteroidales bacterium]
MKYTYFLMVLLLLLFSSSHSQTWEWVNPIPQSYHLNAIDFVNDSVGCAIGQYGSILRT